MNPVRSHTFRLPALALVASLAAGACDSSPTEPTVASVDVTAPTNEVRVGQTLELTATPRDEDGNPVSDQEVTWSSSDESLATVSQAGVVTGVAEGTVVITAEVASVTGNLELQVLETAVVESVSPDVLRPGEEFTVTGQNFSPTPGQNEVLVHFTPAEILSESETSITARLPDFVCGAEGEAPVMVVAGGDESPPFTHPFEPTGVMELAQGEVVRMASPDARCLLLGSATTQREYLVGFQSTSGVVGARTPMTIRGFAGEELSALAGAAGTLGETEHHRARPIRGITRDRREQAVRELLRRTGAGETAERWLRHRAEEQRIRAAEEWAMATLHQTGPSRHQTLAMDALAASVPGDVEAGDTVSVRVPDINGNICQDSETVEGIVRRVGEHSIWVEDPDNPELYTQENFDFLSDEFDDVIYDELVGFFNEPTDLDENDRIVIVITRRVNEMRANVLGFVVSSDFFPDDCPASNGGEYYYAKAPDPDGSIQDADGETRQYPREAALSDAPLLLAHETTHIIQFGRRFLEVGAAGPQGRWLLEGQATLAEEVVGHRYTGFDTRSNLGFDEAWNEHPPRQVAWYQNAFIDLALYYGAAFDDQGNPFRVEEAPHACGWLDLENPEPCFSGRIGYGVTWSLLRWLSDHYADDLGADGEREFQRRIVDSSASGFQTIAGAIGRPIREEMPAWVASLYTDGRLLGGDAVLAFPSWDLRDIEEGLIEEARLTPEEPGFSTFARTLEVASGSTTFQLYRSGVTGHAPFSVGGRTAAGDELPEIIQLWIVRIQ